MHNYHNNILFYILLEGTVSFLCITIVQQFCFILILLVKIDPTVTHIAINIKTVGMATCDAVYYTGCVRICGSHFSHVCIAFRIFLNAGTVGELQVKQVNIHVYVRREPLRQPLI